MNWVFCAALAIPLFFASFFLFRLWQSLSLIKKSLARLAKKDFRTVIVSQPLGFFSKTAQDLQTLSELLQQQEQLLLEEGFSLKTILTSMAEGVLIADSSLKIRLANDALASMLALDRSPIGRNLPEVLLNSDFLRAASETFSKNSAQTVEFALLRGNGAEKSERFFEAYSSPVSPVPHLSPNGTSPLTKSAVIVLRDITKLKKLETVRKEFVANVSHEFRTPLSIIGGYIETLLEGDMNDPASLAKFLSIMQKNCERLNLLIADLLVISQLEHQSLPLRFSNFSLQSLASRIVEDTAPSIAGCRASFSFAFSPPNIELHADLDRMEQVFLNLLGNALRYGGTAESPPEIKISASLQANFVEICFSDCGQGIPYPDQPFLFDRFYRVHKDRARNAGGTGLGLSIVKNIVLAHGGTVTLQSTPGKGSNFFIRIPHQKSPSQQDTVARIQNPEPSV